LYESRGSGSPALNDSVGSPGAAEAAFLFATPFCVQYEVLHQPEDGNE
jgi:hypothetical protein